MTLKEMYKSMMRNAYREKNVEELDAIKLVLEMTPMKIFMDGQMSMSDIRELEIDIDTMKVELMFEESE
jgi:hypothetical protein